MDLTMKLVRNIEEVVDDFGWFLDAIADPTGRIGRTIEQHLTPLTDFLDKGKPQSTPKRLPTAPH
ncbi:hypothetical protein [Rhodococcus sp. H29-C3]|uniref:hypothetical protein n=1 Tax=Rhodococcus sp. H29-C3 TaxID=3046307 RepID=UPI0024BA97DD|nr:hypothetical protein [Rhodococcus sp. H29-C3]MDJ0359733.1 hypothetical protein [Rhodococcus sp. H29-C3]